MLLNRILTTLFQLGLIAAVIGLGKAIWEEEKKDPMFFTEKFISRWR